MAKFYLDLEAKNEVGNQIHESQCSHLPAKESVQYIGSYSNAQAAHYDVKMYHSLVTYCPDCLPQ